MTRRVYTCAWCKRIQWFESDHDGYLYRKCIDCDEVCKWLPSTTKDLTEGPGG